MMIRNEERQTCHARDAFGINVARYLVYPLGGSNFKTGQRLHTAELQFCQHSLSCRLAV